MCSSSLAWLAMKLRTRERNRFAIAKFNAVEPGVNIARSRRCAPCTTDDTPSCAYKSDDALQRSRLLPPHWISTCFDDTDGTLVEVAVSFPSLPLKLPSRASNFLFAQDVKVFVIFHYLKKRAGNYPNPRRIFLCSSNSKCQLTRQWMVPLLFL